MYFFIIYLFLLFGKVISPFGYFVISPFRVLNTPKKHETLVASSQTSFEVRSSCIHFSPTEEKYMRDERTAKDMKGRLRGGYKHSRQLNFIYFVCKNTRNDSKVCCPLMG